MSRRRCVLHCEGQPSMHRLPKDESLKNQWIKFIFNTVPQDYSPNLLLCSNHFREDCFLNRQQYNSGFAQRLVLKDDATPTLFGPGDPQPQPDAACRIFPSVRHAASQTDPPETRSVGTQLIMKAPVRSTGTFGPQMSAEMEPRTNSYTEVTEAAKLVHTSVHVSKQNLTKCFYCVVTGHHKHNRVNLLLKWFQLK
ncbi:uncharacterized protein LOC123972204 isoform X4 [Micropterus dolomieu]|uniref:uncharacterized protein LOC123972204 isoform X4 n=1 Tax=Micropterus dolomieu TaxID=147949 RepID=UPI001E8D792D|nr:uncharacterized protein LOC123972204 isoform X4 [Micropterus dolomieu]